MLFFYSTKCFYMSFICFTKSQKTVLDIQQILCVCYYTFLQIYSSIIKIQETALTWKVPFGKCSSIYTLVQPSQRSGWWRRPPTAKVALCFCRLLSHPRQPLICLQIWSLYSEVLCTWTQTMLFWGAWFLTRASLVAQLVNNLPEMQKTWLWSLGWEDPLEKGKAYLL